MPQRRGDRQDEDRGAGRSGKGYCQNMDSFSIDPESPLSTWGQVQRDLQRRIEAEEFQPGDRLPSETDLAAYYGVSRMTVHRAVQSLARLGVLESKRGSGIYVASRLDQARYDVNLLRPWREQLLAGGHVARSRLLERSRECQVHDSLAYLVENDSVEQFTFGLHLQEVDGTPIAITNSWVPSREQEIVVEQPASALAIAVGTIQISYATRSQAHLLGIPRDTALLALVTCSRLRETGELIELARTSWVANRVRLKYGRSLTVGQIDMSELLRFPQAGETAPTRKRPRP